MQTKKNKRIKGKGWFVNEYNIIYVCGTIEGTFKRVTTKMEANTKNLIYIKHKSNARDELIARTSKTKSIKTDFENFGIEAIKSGAKTKRADGTWSKKGRGTSSQKSAEISFYKHLLPYFKNFSLEDINAHLVEDWQSMKDHQGYASDSISKWRNYLSQIMDRAVKYELVSTNKVELADTIEIVHKKTEGFSVDQARKMMKHSTGKIKAWLFLAFNSGLRVGELKGIQLTDIDFNHKCIYIQRAIAQNVITVTSTTKNHSRIVYFSNYTADILKEYIESNNIKHWLFESNKGTFYKSSSTLEKYYFQPLLKELKIKGTLGMTRKTFASVAKSYAMEEEARQSTMGHRPGSNVTDNHYTFPTMTEIQAQKGQESLAPVNDVLFIKKVAKV
ncbi:MAG: Site-specific tyrosine recombinase, phage integrase family (INT_ICEBs1_C_like domain) [uncultured Sulfurovum sp.]|uniref:Site-specific tyrosine recombinase, phage integrase family (INT_ICEBs1_C_like domain) n=1 Tax=uncultured Sulfurovum sp. TaxID=269237 RepID=A0A6S6SV52_9BACT|nr:MAG: Site-specific tyrosine recombinase, phage integrase family (INT_ICEBs1_C_like domain) [uncultured Sulfurovum sp.]